MSLTQIPLEPPTERLPEQGDLFDASTWESAYREIDDFPTLLIQARDELARSRKREAFWISLVAHIVLLLLIVNFQKFEKYLPQRAVMLVHSGHDNDKLTFLSLPPDAQKAVTPPKTNVMSDKTRNAMSKAPQLDRQQLKKLLDASRQGRPGPQAPPTPQRQAAPQPTPPQNAQAPPQQTPQTQPTPPPAQMAKLQTPQVTPKPSFKTEPMSAGRAINQAAQEAVANRSRYAGGDNGDLGLGQRQPTARMGDLEVMSDTMGVDFGPYLQRVLHDVKQNWYTQIPQSAYPPLLKKGKVSIEFWITKNGSVDQLRIVSTSGDEALDTAAHGGINLSSPFPPLPKEFAGKYLGLRFTFLYNPDKNEADLR